MPVLSSRDPRFDGALPTLIAQEKIVEAEALQRQPSIRTLRTFSRDIRSPSRITRRSSTAAAGDRRRALELARMNVAISPTNVVQSGERKRDRCRHAGVKPMIKVSVMYPNKPGVRRSRLLPRASTCR